MAPHNRPVTLHDVASNFGPGSPFYDNSSSLSFDDLKVCVIPNLPDCDSTQSMLNRVVREFWPIIKRRGYHVISISELCCCGDGLDYDPNRRGQKKKLRKASDNIWGYNQTTRTGTGLRYHTIHLRLRHAKRHHRFHDYEDVAGTLAHELAHCEHGNHNDKFYKLMDDILEEHATVMSQTLGNNNNNNNNEPAAPNHEPAWTENGLGALEQRKLGGDSNFQQWMTPREAAVLAAMVRRRQEQLRLRANLSCQPCNPTCLEIVEEDPDHNNNNNNNNPLTKPTTDSKKKNSGTVNHADKAPTNKRAKLSPVLVDLTNTSDDERDPTKAGAFSSWNCQRCTFSNWNGNTICEMCLHPR